MSALLRHRNPKQSSIFDIKTVFPRGLSLECCEGDQNGEHIEFTSDFPLPIGKLRSRPSPFQRYETAPIPMYHSHVLWSYAFAIVQQQDGSVIFELRNAGPYLRRVVNDIAQPNQSCAQSEPDIVAATFTFTDKEGEEEKKTFELASDGTSTKSFTVEELYAYADDESIFIRLRIIIARSYFNLSKLLEEQGTRSSERGATVEAILRGDKPEGYDCAIKVSSIDGDSDRPLAYYVHSAAFARVSEKFKQALNTGRSVDSLIIMSPGDNKSCTIPSFTPDDMPVLVSIAYGTKAPLPTNISRIGILGRALAHFLNWEKTFFVFPHWERAICEEALKLDKSTMSSFAPLLDLLMIVWCTPYGSLPLAKRVAIGVFADMVWLNTPKGEHYLTIVKSLDSPFFASLAPNELDPIRSSVLMHIAVITGVRKIGLASMIPEEGTTATVDSPPSPRDFSSPTVVPIDDHTEESEDREESKWQCAIS